MDGFGTIYFAYGGNFVGFCVKNKVNGPGVLSLPNGDRYMGTVKKNLYIIFNLYLINKIRNYMENSSLIHALEEIYLYNSSRVMEKRENEFKNGQIWLLK